MQFCGDYSVKSESINRAYYILEFGFPTAASGDSLDWKGLTAPEMEERILPRLRNGSIILFHAGAVHTAEALPALLEEIRAEGYGFSTVGDMIYKEKYSINHEGRQLQSAA